MLLYIKKNGCKYGCFLLTLTPTRCENGKIKKKNVEIFGYHDYSEMLLDDPNEHFQENDKQYIPDKAHESEPIHIISWIHRSKSQDMKLA